VNQANEIDAPFTDIPMRGSMDEVESAHYARALTIDCGAVLD
jgi:hypothetical protein